MQAEREQATTYLQEQNWREAGKYLEPRQLDKPLDDLGWVHSPPTASRHWPC